MTPGTRIAPVAGKCHSHSAARLNREISMTALPSPALPVREPLNKPRVAATEAFRDEMPHLPTEATRRPWQAPRASGATADRPRSWQLSPVPSGLRAGHSSALLRGLRIGTSYSLRPQLPNEA